MKFRLFSALSLALGAFLSGCNSKDASPPPPKAMAAASTATPTPASMSAEKTSFAEVTAQLDPGGSIYAYLSTARWLEGLSGKVSEGRELLLSIPGMDDDAREQLGRTANLLTSLVKQSGLEAISGVGYSGIAVEPGFYRSKFVTHHFPGKGDGYLWHHFGTAPHALDFAAWLPTNTVWAMSFDTDLPGLWKAVREQVRQSGIADAETSLNEWVMMVETASGLKFDDLLASTDGQFGFALTLNPDKQVIIPLPAGPALKVPDVRLAIALKVRDDRWFDWAKRAFEGNSQIITGDDTALGLRMRTLPQPIPVPFEFRPTVARAGNYLWFTTHDELMQDLAQVKAGKLPGLQSSDEFRKLARNLPLQGNQFQFVGQGFQALPKAIRKGVSQAAAQQGGAQPMAMIEKYFNTDGEIGSLTVGAVGPQGWLSVSQGYQPPGVAMILPVVVAPVAIAAGMTLPALAKAKAKAQSIQCVNNLKQLGLGARIYAVDHGDKLPPDVFSLKQEVGSPRVLFCAEDPKGAQFRDLKWEDIRPEMISYEYLGAGKTDSADPRTAIFRCRIHGHECFLDGSVQQSTGRRP